MKSTKFSLNSLITTHINRLMTRIFDGSIVIALALVAVFAYSSNYLSYYNCMSQTRSEAITPKGIDQVSAQCRAFILDKIMTK